jgi:hypothetical protein
MVSPTTVTEEMEATYIFVSRQQVVNVQLMAAMAVITIMIIVVQLHLLVIMVMGGKAATLVVPRVTKDPAMQ